jgi:uncharacterized protein YjaG (DUF416 family)
MSMIRFDEQDLVRQLQRMPNRLGVAFAAACAERQFPNYLRFSNATKHGNPNLLMRALRCVWDDIEGSSESPTLLREHLALCMSLLPSDDKGDFFRLAYYAEDAVAAVAYAIEARLRSEVEEAVEAARRAYAALDEHVSTILDIQIIDQEQEERMVSHPLIQAELCRQQADLSQLQKIASGMINETDGIADLRRRAQSDAKVFFGPEPA